MGKPFKPNIFPVFILPVYAVLLFLFFIKYVPLVIPFQLFLVPVLVIVLTGAALSPERGTLAFLFFLPLINSLPYFFGLFEHIPHAPTALVLFLFYVFGLLVHSTRSKPDGSALPGVFHPIFFFAGIVTLSALITFFRYANFWPFLTPEIYELIANVQGVTTGGAFMSLVFHALSYLTGLAFFVVLVILWKTGEPLRRAASVLTAGLFLSAMFGWIQHLIDPSLGNTPFWVGLGQINSTFKDPNSFGVFLAMIFPLSLGLALSAERRMRLGAIAACALALLVFPYIGSRSGFLGLIVSLVTFLLLWGLSLPGIRRIKPGRKILAAAALLVVLLISIWGILNLSRSRLLERLETSSQSLSSGSGWLGLSPERYFLWREGVRMLRDYPLSGVGIGAYIIELPNYYELDTGLETPVPLGYRRNDSAENYFLHIAAEMGIPGLIFILWIFGLLLRQALRGFDERNLGSRYHFLYFGAAAGLTSSAVNFLFHSYIGSYEIKYTFWFLAASLFILGRKSPAPEKDRRKAGKLALSSVLILLFGVSLLWNSTRSLSLRHRTELLPLRQNFGLYQAEHRDDGSEFHWTGAYGGLSFRLTKPVIEVPIHASHPDIARRPLHVKISLVEGFFRSKTLLEDRIIDHNRWDLFRCTLPEHRGQDVILLFEVGRTWSPLEYSGIPDDRKLGLALGEIRQNDEHP